ncbi:MAG: hypothetical protein ACM3H8_12720 [Sphingobacteriales bacterium]
MWKQILKTTLIAGSLDITAACIHAYLLRGTTPATVLRYIASGVLGKEAFTGGYGTMALGLVFHFIIAFSCATVFFLLYPKLKFLHRSIVLNSLLIALVAWAITTQIIIRLSKIQPPVFNLGKAAIAAAILFVCIGLPISFFAKRFFQPTKL